MLRDERASKAPEPQVVVQTKIVDTFCDWAKPIYVDKPDVMTDEMGRAILALNRLWVEAAQQVGPHASVMLVEKLVQVGPDNA